MWLEVAIRMTKSVFFSKPKNTSRIQLLNLTLEFTKKSRDFRKVSMLDKKLD